jgi:hypothetical protein
MPTEDEIDWLGQRAGWVLLALGVVLIGLAVTTAGHEAVAAIFAFSGAATAIFGVLLSRLEGPFEISPTRFSGVLKKLKNVSAREDLTFEERANLLLKILGVSGASTPAPPPAAPPARREAPRARRGAPAASGRDATSTGAGPTTSSEIPTRQQRPPLPRPVPFTVTGETDRAGAVAQAFERFVIERFRADGWEVDAARSMDRGFDFKAQKDETEAFVEVKLRRRFSAADAAALIGAVKTWGETTDQWILAINAGALSGAAREQFSAFPAIEVWEVPIEGW